MIELMIFPAIFIHRLHRKSSMAGSGALLMCRVISTSLCSDFQSDCGFVGALGITNSVGHFPSDHNGLHMTSYYSKHHVNAMKKLLFK